MGTPEDAFGSHGNVPHLQWHIQVSMNAEMMGGQASTDAAVASGLCLLNLLVCEGPVKIQSHLCPRHTTVRACAAEWSGPPGLDGAGLLPVSLYKI